MRKEDESGSAGGVEVLGDNKYKISPLTEDKYYRVILKPAGTASMGYCAVDISYPSENKIETIYTPQIKKSETGSDDSYTFTLSVSAGLEDVVVEFIPQWGTYSGTTIYSEGEEIQKMEIDVAMLLEVEPKPVVTPTPTPSATPTPTAEPEPSATPTPTAEPIPTVTVTPEPTAVEQIMSEGEENLDESQTLDTESKMEENLEITPVPTPTEFAVEEESAEADLTNTSEPETQISE